MEHRAAVAENKIMSNVHDGLLQKTTGKLVLEDLHMHTIRCVCLYETLITYILLRLYSIM